MYGITYFQGIIRKVSSGIFRISKKLHGRVLKCVFISVSVSKVL